MKKLKTIFNNKLYLVLILIATIFMSVGYASINSVILEVSGSITAISPEGLFISSVVVDDENTINGINETNVANNTFLSSKIALGNELTSTLTIIVNICNKYSDDRIFNSLRYLDLTEEELEGNLELSNLYSNNDIVIDESSFSSLVGTKLASNSCMDIPVTFKYDENLETITNNVLDLAMNFKFDDLDEYASNITYAINSTTGTFENKDSQLNYEITVTNNNPYTIKYQILGDSTEDIILDGIASNIEVAGNSSQTSTIILSPAREIYDSFSDAAIDIKVQVTEPIILDSNNYTIKVRTFAQKLSEIILAQNTLIETTPSYAINVTTAANSGLFKTVDESGTTYYFRGVIDNNYVKFADKMWRLVRINGDGTYRLILDSSAGYIPFSTDTSSLYNVGYMYGDTLQSNTNSSYIKTWLENWYTENLDAYDEYIDKDAIFWQDRTMSSTNNVFAAWIRIVNNKPTLQATTVADMFSVTKTKGNGLLTKPIGLITADEAVLAGATMTGATSTGYGTVYTNQSYYLYTSDLTIYGYWTLTPRRLYSAANNHMIVSKGGASIFSEPALGTNRSVRPVINLKSDINFKGLGTQESPYTIIN